MRIRVWSISVVLMAGLLNCNGVLWAEDAVVAPALAPAEAAGEPEEKEGSFDTVNIKDGSGNWLLKRIWFERGQEKYDKIKERVDEVLQLRAAFFDQRTELDQKLLEPFYLEIGLQEGELQVTLTDLTQEITELRQKLGDLTQQERELLELVTGEQKTLEQLQADVMAIKDVDNAVDDALSKLMEQMNLCRKYEKESWQYLRDIAKELSDKNAKAIYYKMDVHSKNISNILKYVQSTFTDYFNQLISMAKTRTERVKSSMAMFKEKGIDFQKRAKIVKDLAARREHGDIEAEKAKAVQAAIEQTTESLSWHARFTQWLGAVHDWFKSAYDSVAGWFASKQEAPAASPEHVEPVAQTSEPAAKV